MKNLFIYLIIVLFSVTSHSQCWQSIASGLEHTLAIKSDGTLWSWGLNDSGQLGIGTDIYALSSQDAGGYKCWKNAIFQTTISSEKGSRINNLFVIPVMYIK